MWSSPPLLVGGWAEEISPPQIEIAPQIAEDVLPGGLRGGAGTSPLAGRLASGVAKGVEGVASLFARAATAAAAATTTAAITTAELPPRFEAYANGIRIVVAALPSGMRKALHFQVVALCAIIL